MKKYVNLVEPASYILVVPEPVRAAYLNIETWRWVNITELIRCCLDLHQRFVEWNGKPPKEGINVGWATNGPNAIFEDFGALMHDNDFRQLFAGRPVRYRYAIRRGDIQPSAGDFRIDVEMPPSEDLCRQGNIFVPKGWADEVSGLVLKGFFKVCLQPNGLARHRIDGTVEPLTGK